MEKLRIMLVDDHILFRQGVRHAMESEPDFEIAGEAADGGEAIQLARVLSPDVILMDINMPVVDGLEVNVRVLGFHEGKELILEASDGSCGIFIKVAIGAHIDDGHLLFHGQGLYWGCFRISTRRTPRFSWAWVDLSSSLPNCGKGRQFPVLGQVQTQLPATCFMALIWALPPTRETESPTLMAGRTPEKNRLGSRKICPSVMEITLVGI